MSGYESLAWIKDESGHELVCPVEGLRKDFADGEKLSPEERARCMDVNLIVGTERW